MAAWPAASTTPRHPSSAAVGKVSSKDAQPVPGVVDPTSLVPAPKRSLVWPELDKSSRRTISKTCGSEKLKTKNTFVHLEEDQEGSDNEKPFLRRAHSVEPPKVCCIADTEHCKSRGHECGNLPVLHWDSCCATSSKNTMEGKQLSVSSSSVVTPRAQLSESSKRDEDQLEHDDDPIEGELNTSGATAWWTIAWCNERCYKSELSGQREELMALGACVRCFKKAAKFERWLTKPRKTCKEFMLLTNWREAKPCLIAADKLSASASTQGESWMKPCIQCIVIICDSRRQFTEVSAWALRRSPDVVPAYVVEDFKQAETLLLTMRPERGMTPELDGQAVPASSQANHVQPHGHQRPKTQQGRGSSSDTPKPVDSSSHGSSNALKTADHPFQASSGQSQRGMQSRYQSNPPLCSVSGSSNGYHSKAWVAPHVIPQQRTYAPARQLYAPPSR